MESGINWKRFSVALIVGSAVSAQVLSMLHYLNGPHGLTWEVLPYTPLLALTYLMFMLPTAFLVGAPISVMLRRLGWLNGGVVVFVGTLAGAAWAIPALGYKPAPFDLAIFFGLGGLLASATFWLVYKSANKANPADAEKRRG